MKNTHCTTFSTIWNNVRNILFKQIKNSAKASFEIEMAHSHTTFLALRDSSYFNNEAKKAKGMSEWIFFFPYLSQIKMKPVAWQNTFCFALLCFISTWTNLYKSMHRTYLSKQMSDAKRRNIFIWISHKKK